MNAYSPLGRFVGLIVLAVAVALVAGLLVGASFAPGLAYAAAGLAVLSSDARFVHRGRR